MYDGLKFSDSMTAEMKLETGETITGYSSREEVKKFHAGEIEKLKVYLDEESKSTMKKLGLPEGIVHISRKGDISGRTPETI